METPGRGAKNFTMLAPHHERRSVKKDGMAEKANGASHIAEPATNDAKGQGLVIQMGGFVAEDAFTNRTEQGRASGLAQRLIKGNSKDLRRYEDRHASFQSGQFAKPAKRVVNPVAGEPGNPLAIQEVPQHEAVPLFL